MTYRDMDSMPDGPCVSVLTRACNVRGCRLINGVPHYRSVHGEWFDATRYDPPQKWWDGPIPGSRSGRYRYPEMLNQPRGLSADTSVDTRVSSQKDSPND